MKAKYFVFGLELYSVEAPEIRQTQRILTKCEYEIKDGRYIFSDIQILQKEPNFPTPFSISPKFFEFNSDVDLALPYDIVSDEAAKVYFTLKYGV